MTDEIFRLCYVRDNWAFFTTRDVTEQWGDDWDDAPYEHNAGDPIPYCLYMKKHNIEPYEIKRIAFDGDWEQPCSNVVSSSYSVQQINAGKVPWLQTPKWIPEPVKIMAGTTLDDFIRIVRDNDGQIWLPME
jgi:hypothetical protein